MRYRQVLPPIAERELARCCEEGRTAYQTLLRLAAVGVAASERSICRRMSEYRREQKELCERDLAAKQRLSEFEAIGRGLGSVQLGVAGVAEILKSTGPEFRQRQAEGLTNLFQQFLETPTPDLLCGLAVGLHSFLLGDSLLRSLRGNGA